MSYSLSSAFFQGKSLLEQVLYSKFEPAIMGF